MSSTLQGSFPRTARLLTGADFNHVFKGRNQRFGNRYWTILVVRQSEKIIESGQGARVGMAIAKKRARRAVDRNRLKRHVRESFRGKRSQLGNIDVVVMNRDSAASATPEELRQSLAKLWNQIKKTDH